MDSQKKLIVSEEPNGTRVLSLYETDEDGDYQLRSVTTSTGTHRILSIEDIGRELVLPVRRAS